MLKPILVGEAPSEKGDGRPFTGPSGDRLQALLGLESYDQLASTFEMTNLFEKVTRPVWDRFDRRFAQKRAMTLMTRWQELVAVRDELMDVLLAGRKVMASFGVEGLPWFDFKLRGNVVLWAFPHPSGLNHFWNERENVLGAAQFLRARVSGARTHHPSEQYLLDLNKPQAP